jgi:parallel beta-helix repeat protein
MNHLNIINHTPTSPATGCPTGMGVLLESDPERYTTMVITNSHVQNFQKNGITANGPRAYVTISGNTIVGSGPTSSAVQNGVQIGYGASGKVLSNLIVDTVWTPARSSDPPQAAAGILVFASPKPWLAGNTISNTQLGIAVVSDEVVGSANGGRIMDNKISATHSLDGIELCGSSGNTVQDNTVSGSDRSAFHVDSTCGAVTKNDISNNIVNGACAGVLAGSGAGTNTIANNKFFNVLHTILTGDQCTGLMPRSNASVSVSTSYRLSPAKP